jgi:hypothetical protein
VCLLFTVKVLLLLPRRNDSSNVPVKDDSSVHHRNDQMLVSVLPHYFIDNEFGHEVIFGGKSSKMDEYLKKQPLFVLW